MEKRAMAVREEQWIQTIAAAKQSGQPIVSASRNGVLAKPSLTVRELFHVVGVYF